MKIEAVVDIIRVVVLVLFLFFPVCFSFAEMKALMAYDEETEEANEDQDHAAAAVTAKKDE